MQDISYNPKNIIIHSSKYPLNEFVTLCSTKAKNGKVSAKIGSYFYNSSVKELSVKHKLYQICIEV